MVLRFTLRWLRLQVDWKVAICMEQFIRMLHHVGLPTTDIDFVYSDGPVFNELIVKGNSRMCLFTGSQVRRRPHRTPMNLTARAALSRGLLVLSCMSPRFE